jgi:twitching motility protein PilT
VRAALQAAETGHLVMSTLHTQDATETVNRVIDFFPPHQQKQVRLSLAGTLRGIICQRLVPTVDGGRTPALEILVNTGRVAERITDEEKTSEIKEVVAEGGYYGMMTFDQALLKLIQQGVVSVEDAMQAVSSKHDFELALQQAGMPLLGHDGPQLSADPEPAADPETAANPDTTAPAGVADVLGGAPTGVEVSP